MNIPRSTGMKYPLITYVDGKLTRIYIDEALPGDTHNLEPKISLKAAISNVTELDSAKRLEILVKRTIEQLRNDPNFMTGETQ